jgi:hypothetical protein
VATFFAVRTGTTAVVGSCRPRSRCARTWHRPRTSHDDARSIALEYRPQTGVHGAWNIVSTTGEKLPCVTSSKSKSAWIIALERERGERVRDGRVALLLPMACRADRLVRALEDADERAVRRERGGGTAISPSRVRVVPTTRRTRATCSHPSTSSDSKWKMRGAPHPPAGCALVTPMSRPEGAPDHKGEHRSHPNGSGLVRACAGETSAR